MPETPLTNEQKLTEIYEILKIQESVRKRALWWGLFRRIFIYGLILIVALNPKLVMSKLTEILMPVVMNSLKGTMQTQGGDFIKEMKNIMQNEQPAN